MTAPDPWASLTSPRPSTDGAGPTGTEGPTQTFPRTPTLLQLASKNVGPDPEFERIAKLNRLPIHPVHY